jgi:hypothetical protein
LASKNQKKRYPKSSISSMGTYRVYGLASIPDLYCSINSTGPSSKNGEKVRSYPTCHKKSLPPFLGALTIGWQHRKAHGAFAMERMSDTQIHLISKP